MGTAYQAFAKVYDAMQYDVDYAFWVKAILEKTHAYKPTARSVLELACGTGTIAIGLSKKGLYVEGVDISEEMLTRAQEKAYNSGQRIKFYCQNMVELETRRKYDVLVSMCDGLNYVTDLADLKKVFLNVQRHLEPKGLFVFDLSTRHKLEHVIGNSTFAETFQDSAYIWENEFDPKQSLLHFWLTLFVEEHGAYVRYEEYHKQRAYTYEEIIACMPASFEILECLDGESFEGFRDDSERMCIIARLKD